MRIIILFLFLLTLNPTYSKTLTVGVPHFSPPFIMSADNKNHYSGFSIDIMSAICNQMKVKCQFKTLPFEATFTQVIDHTIDLAIGAFTITAEREQEVLFSLPYLQSRAAVVALTKSDINMLSNLAGKTIGVEKGSVFEGYLKKQYGDNIRIVFFSDISQMMFALNNEDIDTVIYDKEIADFWVGNNYHMFKIIGEPFALGQGIGLFTNLDNTQLINQINQILVQMETNGRYLNIYNAYFGDMQSVSFPLY
jgi:ABC-type amino acid transport substrate-binding protein